MNEFSFLNMCLIITNILKVIILQKILIKIYYDTSIGNNLLFLMRGLIIETIFKYDQYYLMIYCDL